VSKTRGFLVTLGVASLLVSGCAKPAGTHATEVQKLQARAAYERALQLITEKQASPALAALKEAIDIDGNVTLYRSLLGLLYLDLQRPELALEQFQKAVEIDPKLADAWFHRGVALSEMRRWEDAIESYRKAVALPTLSVPDLAHQSLGMALYNVRRYAEAEQALRFAINLDPQLQAAYYNLGLVFAAEERRDEAKAAFRRARQLAPNTPFGEAAGDRLKALGEM
jgi:tetratricopeptide (TPR) repeat protein